MTWSVQHCLMYGPSKITDVFEATLGAFWARFKRPPRIFCAVIANLICSAELGNNVSSKLLEADGAKWWTIELFFGSNAKGWASLFTDQAHTGGGGITKIFWNSFTRRRHSLGITSDCVRGVPLPKHLSVWSQPISESPGCLGGLWGGGSWKRVWYTFTVSEEGLYGVWGNTSHLGK